MHCDRETIRLSRIPLKLRFIFGSPQTKGRTAWERGRTGMPEGLLGRRLSVCSPFVRSATHGNPSHIPQSRAKDLADLGLDVCHLHDAGSDLRRTELLLGAV